MYKVLLTTFLVVFSYVAFAQGQAAMIQQAIQAGASQQQINQAISAFGTNGKAANSNTTTNSSKTVNPAIERTINSYNSTQNQEGKIGIFEYVDSTKIDVENEEMLLKKAEKETIKKVYGREIFSSENLTFAPSYNIPTPKNYILSSSDEIIVKIWGASKDEYRLMVSPEGTISLSSLGPVFVSGLTIEKAESLLRNELAQIIQGVDGEYPTTFISVTLGAIRSIKVNIMGEVSTPGTYTLPSLATLFNAMYVAGGVNDIGSLRDIQLFRNGRKIASLDVYNFIFKGDNNTNVRLEDGDMVIVYPYKSLVTINGKIKRNLAFELKEGETMSNLVYYAGGFTGDAFEDFLNIDRSTGSTRETFTVNKLNYPNFVMNDSDVVTVNEVLDVYVNTISIGGAVWRGGRYGLNNETNSISKLVNKAGGVKPGVFYGKGHILRPTESGINELVSFNLGDILNGNSADVEVLSNDNIYIYSVFELRENYTVTIDGAVQTKGTMPFIENMTLKDLIQKSGGLLESASTSKIEISRRIRNPSDTVYSPTKSKLFVFDITSSLDLNPNDEEFLLEPYDVVIVRNSPNYSAQRYIYIEGEVLYEGKYVIANKGMRLSDLVHKSGGITPEAYIVGARLERQINKEERAKLESILDLNTDGRDSLSTSNIALKTVYSVGINLEKALATPGSFDDVILREGDKLVVPEYVSTVSINGAVRRPNVVTYTNNKKIKNYISDSGGYVQRAKKNNVYVVYMNGNVSKGKRSLILPGCEIIVPMKLEKSGGGAGLMTGLSILNTTLSTAAMVSNLIK